MCGIYGYIGKLDAYKVVVSGLKMLQYRGYDSCGIAYYNNGFCVNKMVGTLDRLKECTLKPNIAFGHTRWATNGVVNLNNTHPHVSFDGKFTLVHNGIITNASELKNKLLKKDIKFYSDTDTEVIANLLASKQGNIDNRIKSLFYDLKGTFSLIIGLDKGDLYLLKKFSPLNILKADDGIYLSSDISSLKNGNLYTLKDYDIIKIHNGNIESLTENQIEFKPFKLNKTNLDKGKYAHFMLKEIEETPFAIKQTFKFLKRQQIKKIFKNINEITLLGCGTAYNSCLIGEYFFKNSLNYRVETVLASNYKINHKIKRNHLHIIVSQSGETADCIKVAEKIKLAGGKILVITNEEYSTILKFADYKLLTKAGKEQAVASTKTYNCQLFTFYYIVKKLKNKNFKFDILKFQNQLSKYIKSVKLDNDLHVLNKDKLLLVGGGIDYLTLVEASLKIREINYIFTLPMYSGELKHGTLSLIDETSITLALDSYNSSVLDNIKNEIMSRKGKIVDFSKYLHGQKIDNMLKPIFAIIPFQLLSYKLALIRGINPDMPRNLAKSVTVE